MIKAIALAGSAVLLFPLAAAADLSGDLRVTVTDAHGKATTQSGKLYLDGAPESKERTARMELTPAGADEPLVFLTRPQDNAMYMVMPGAKAYMKMSLDEGMQKSPRAPGQGLDPADFKTVGSERVEGRRTIVKEAPIREGEKTTGTIRIYVAPDLGNEPVKSVVENDRGTTATSVISNPKQGELPDSLFAVPSGYAETKLPSLNKMLQGIGEGVEDETEDAAKEQQDKAADEVRKGLRERLPF